MRLILNLLTRRSSRSNNFSISALFAIFITGLLIFTTQNALAQTREQGPWWPSPHGIDDQAGASNYVTPAKILGALQIPKNGKTYELGHIYEQAMPLYGERPMYMSVTPPPEPSSGEGGI